MGRAVRGCLRALRLYARSSALQARSRKQRQGHPRAERCKQHQHGTRIFSSRAVTIELWWRGTTHRQGQPRQSQHRRRRRSRRQHRAHQQGRVSSKRRSRSRGSRSWSASRCRDPHSPAIKRRRLLASGGVSVAPLWRRLSSIGKRRSGVSGGVHWASAMRTRPRRM